MGTLAFAKGDYVVVRNGAALYRVARIEQRKSHMVNTNIAYGTELESVVHVQRVSLCGDRMTAAAATSAFPASQVTRVDQQWIADRIVFIRARAERRIEDWECIAAFMTREGEDNAGSE